MSIREWDDGVASERTVLAWERTAISTIAVAAITLRQGIVNGPLGLAIPIAALALALALFEWRYSLWVKDSHHDRPLERGAVLHDRAMIGVGFATLLVAVGAAALAITG